MLRLGLGAGVVAVVFLAGCWTGQRLAWAEQARAALAAVAETEAQGHALRRAEMERLRTEAALDLALGEVVANAADLAGGDVVFTAERMRGLFPAR